MNYIIPNTNNKPFKLLFENSKFETFTRNKTPKEALLEIIRNMRYNNLITTQQYKSEKGKIRRDIFNEVKNFIKKRGFYEIYLDKINEEILTVTIARKFSPSIIYKKFGVIEV